MKVPLPADCTAKETAISTVTMNVRNLQLPVTLLSDLLFRILFFFKIPPPARWMRAYTQHDFAPARSAGISCCADEKNALSPVFMAESSRGHSVVVYVGIWSDPDRFQNKQLAAAAVNNTIAPAKNSVNMNFIPFQDS